MESNGKLPLHGTQLLNKSYAETNIYHSETLKQTTGLLLHHKSQADDPIKFYMDTLKTWARRFMNFLATR